ncbi:hypothetical protein Zmor_022506 [Zophobas morio]|uniref:Uncharacterized protein n=1 Tax=Zophobas morio TaxID=2755281 RepID=A0AA38HVH3_9CUCU|nr:hypothetical protein Zmor_022506 [Zophobas morio]
MLLKTVTILFSCFLKRSTTCYLQLDYTVVDGHMKRIYNSEEITVVSHTTAGVMIKNEYIPILCCKIFNVKSNIRFVSFDNCWINRIEEECFSEKIENITLQIDIINKQLRSIKTGTFRNLKVQFINLKSNAIEVIEDRSFVNLTLLEELNLSFNHLYTFNSEAFVNLLNFGRLNLESNRITSLQTGSLVVFRKDHSVLNIKCNELTYINRHFLDGMNATNVELHLDENNLVSLPEGIFDYHNFKEINVGKNPLTNVSKFFCSKNCTVHMFGFSCQGVDEESVQETVQNIENWIDENQIILYTDGYCTFNKNNSRILGFEWPSCSASTNSQNFELWNYLKIFIILYNVM